MKNQLQRLVVIFAILAISSTIVTAQEATPQFKDVDPQSWAAEFVTKAVKAGILSGYPDGTFRGSKTITRYEIAKIAVQLMESLGGGGVALDDLQTELKAIKSELKAMRKGTQTAPGISGTYFGRGRVGGFLTGSGGRSPRADYRMLLELSQGIQPGNVVIRLDTMDAGYNAGTRTDLFKDILDIQANFPLSLGWENPLKATFSIGPGTILHTEPTGLIVDEEVYFRRPFTALTLTTTMAGVELMGEYTARGVTSGRGLIGTHHFTAGAKLDISNWINRPGTLLSGNIHYLMRRAGGAPTNDLRGDIAMETLLLPKLLLTGQVGFAGFTNAGGLRVGTELTLNDMFDTGTHISFQVDRLGSSFVTFPEWNEVGGFDYFDRSRRNATWDLGLRATQKFSARWKLNLLWNLKMNSAFQYEGPDALSAFRLEGDYDVAPGATLRLGYDQYGRRSRNTTADLLSAGILYRF